MDGRLDEAQHKQIERGNQTDREMQSDRWKKTIRLIERDNQTDRER